MGGVAVVVSGPVFSTVIPPEKSAVGSGVIPITFSSDLRASVGKIERSLSLQYTTKGSETAMTSVVSLVGTKPSLGTDRRAVNGGSNDATQLEE